MQVRHRFIWSTVLLLGMIAPVLLSGCKGTANRPDVLAFTGTNFGLEVSQNVATQTPQMKLGYNRGEVAIVQNKEDNVLMEFGYGGGSHNIYQRLAVGKEAVQAGTASAMFSKDTTTGAVSQAASEAAKKTSELSTAQTQAEVAKTEPAVAKAQADATKAQAEAAKAQADAEAAKALQAIK